MTASHRASGVHRADRDGVAVPHDDVLTIAVDDDPFPGYDMEDLPAEMEMPFAPRPRTELDGDRPYAIVVRGLTQ